MDFPTSSVYTGDLEDLHRHYEHPHSDIGQHATIYHSGVYDKLEQRPSAAVISTEPYTGELSSTYYQEIQPTPIRHVYHQGYYNKLEERPVETTHTVLKVTKEPSLYDLSHEPYTGPLHSIHHNELQPSPIENLPNQGYYDQLEQKPGLFGSLFRKSHEEEYPKSQPYSGPLSSIQHQEIQPTPIQSLPHQAYYDKLETKPSVMIETSSTFKGII
jgi:hypothetical protein